MRKGNSKIKTVKEGNTNIRKYFYKSSSNEKNETPVSQQIDLQ